MTKLEKEALVLFKDYTHLELKVVQWNYMHGQMTKSGGATEPYELALLNKALEYNACYNKFKLNDKIKT